MKSRMWKSLFRVDTDYTYYDKFKSVFKILRLVGTLDMKNF